MAGEVEAKLEEMGLALPETSAPKANYVPFVVVGNLVHVSGQVSEDQGGLIRGKLGADMDVEAGASAARRCALSLLSQVRAACGGDSTMVPGRSGLAKRARKRQGG